MALKIHVKIAGYGPDDSGNQAVVCVMIEFDGAETASFNVLVPCEGDETAISERAKLRAKGLALEFSALR